MAVRGARAAAGHAGGRVPQLQGAYRLAGVYSARILKGEKPSELLASDLVHRQVSVIVTSGTPAALAAKVATATVPVVFVIGGNPIQLGLVESLNRPGANVTGVTQLNEEVATKRLELLHQLLPTASNMALLVNPSEPALAKIQSSNFLSAAQRLKLELHVLEASTEREFDGVFAGVLQLGAGGLVIGGGPFFIDRQEQLATLSVRHEVPTVFENREFVTAGGLMGYGGSQTDAYRLAGVYSARILKGEKPSELPVQQGTKVELFLNIKTAKALGITFPLSLLGRADEVIE
jgi:putative ABC transport system substrate-binding protein